jgi:hypothetical protein
MDTLEQRREFQNLFLLMKVATITVLEDLPNAFDLAQVSEPFPSNEGRYPEKLTRSKFPLRVSEPFPSNEGRYLPDLFRKEIQSPFTSVSEPFPSNEGRYIS